MSINKSNEGTIIKKILAKKISYSYSNSFPFSDFGCNLKKL